MTESIRRQLAVPPYVSAIYMAVGLGMLGGGIALVAASPSAPVPALPPAAEIAEIAMAVPTPAPRTAVAASEAPAPVADTVQLLFRAGGATYMRLASVERDDEGAIAWPRHGAPRLVTEGAAEVAIAAVRDADMPAVHRAWAGKQVVVDGTCRATVTGFAVVSRLVGDPGYAGLEKERWDAASVMQTGAQVLAARLDRCSGTFARDAALAPVVIPTPIRDERLARTGKSALIASAAAAEVAREWAEHGSGIEGAWWDHAEFSTTVLRHPRTGVTFVAVHAGTDFGCGGPDVNLWGLYAAAADGALSPVHETRPGDLRAIDRIIDVEGDGELELIGRTWRGDDVMLTGADGAEQEHLDMQFYGCRC
jgi:hypothetical protein